MSHSLPSPLRVLLAAVGAASLALAGCAAGPNFKPPAPPEASGYTAHPLSTTAATPGVAAGAAQSFAPGANLPGDWWTLFRSPQLDALIERALKNNHDLKAAQAALRVAHEDVLAQRGAFFPSVSANFDASRAKASNNLAPVPNFPAVPQEFEYNLFTPQLSISYAPDIFGLNRRTRESLKAQEQSARFQMIAAWTTLTSNVVVTAVQESALREQVDATRKSIDIAKQSLAILQLRFRHGDASKLDVAAQQTQLAQAEAALPALVKQQAAEQHALAVLVGAFPDQAPAATFTLADLHLPENLPLSLPSQLVAQRPDVRQARANLHAASAAVGIAAAQRLPNIQLTANAGSTALAISKLFTSGTGFWGIAASLTAPIFEGGQLLHQERAAKAAYVEAAEQYRGTVLTAFQNVADTLVALEQDANGLQAAAKAEQAAQTTLDLSQLQLKHGYIGTFELLAAQQAYQQARIALVTAEANRFADTAALYQALGGGWWHNKNLAKN
ncbi:MAG: Efflux transport system, outer membrane factor (OMF) lipoprotein [Rhodanobacteraceae bacterium]|jgi:NodT family efflux transporter outer membrane factor (OMF) lipoprotein|nr:MAG: Efflux transport system, outer membrane factor (OMF) lipoprotein [Rhodanobacteraceae bacterium]